MVDQVTARKNVIAWSYSSFKMYKRQMFDGNWLTDWQTNIVNSDFEKNDIKFGSSYIQFGAEHGRKCRINYMGQLSKNIVDGGELQPYSDIVTRNDLTIKSNANFLRVGNIVEFHVTNDWINNRSIPEGYRPCGIRHFQLFDSTLSAMADVYFDTTTNVFISDDHNFYGTLTWFTVDVMPS